MMKKSSLTHYKQGHLVMYATENGQLDVTPKLRANIQCPYLVLDRLGDQDYWVQLDTRGKQKVVHHDKLKAHLGHQGLSCAKSALRPTRQRLNGDFQPSEPSTVK